MRPVVKFLRARWSHRADRPGLAEKPDPVRDRLVATGLFDAAFYEHRYPDVKGFPGGAVAHYLKHGARERREIAADFAINDFVRHIDIAPDAEFVALLDAIERHDPNALRADWPARDDTDQAAVVEKPDPVRDRLVATGAFDAAYYQYRYPDVQNFPGGAVAHYLKHGVRERREISPDFNIDDFMRDAGIETGADPEVLIAAIERYEPRTLAVEWPSQDDHAVAYLVDGSGLFDPAWYRARYPDIAAAGIAPLWHFVTRGAVELRHPGPGFDGAHYRDTYPDYRESGRTPIESYLRHGRSVGRAPTGMPIYARWVARFDTLEPPDRARLERIAADAPHPGVGVLIVDAGCAADFAAVLASWVDQIGADWRVCVLPAAGLDAALWARCRDLCQAHPIVDVVAADVIETHLAPGHLVLLGRGACRLRPHARLVFAQALQASRTSAAYADHDRIDPAGQRSGPVFKPAMSPEFMASLPYAGPVVAVRAEPGLGRLVAASLEGGDIGWPDLLRGRDAAQVARVPFILYHLVASEPVAEGALEPVPCGDRSRAQPRDAAPALPHERPSVSVIIPTRDHGDLVRACIDSIRGGSDYPAARIDFVVIDNGTTDPDTLALLEGYRGQPGFTIVDAPGAFNFSGLCNAGARAGTGAVLVFLNNDTTVNQANWLDRLVEHAIKPATGLVGAQLLYPDGTVQHGGVVLGVQGVGAHRGTGLSAAALARTDVTREMTSVTGACLAVRRSVFEELGGFDTVLRVAFNDVDLCIRAVKAGYRNLYVAEPLLIHHESKSRGYDVTRAAQHRNQREAIYARERHAAFFRNDPSYSPNLSLVEIGALAFPPRAIRPWRRSPPGTRRVLLLSTVHGLGHGVATVLAEQAAFLLTRGWEVIVGGPPAKREPAYPGCRRVPLYDAQDAAAFAVEEGLDCVIAHTPPFFSIVRHLGAWPRVYVMDHGEPAPHLFEDVERREDVDWEKRFCAPLAHRVFTISDTIHGQQFRSDAITLRNGNSHLDAWTEAHAARRGAVRARLGLQDRFVVLNVCRFGAGERRYKGIDQYAAVASDLRYRHPALADRVVFTLAGRGTNADIAYVRGIGLTPYSNVTDAEMIDLYVAADLYLNLSAWEGYNLGIGQALAMGLDVLASDIEAHREFGVETNNSVAALCDAVARRVDGAAAAQARRRAVVHPWSTPLSRMAEIVEADLDAARADPEA